MAPLPLCVYDVAAEPPAHCRLVSGHDLFQDGDLRRLYRDIPSLARLRAPAHVGMTSVGPGFAEQIRESYAST
jgi:hypothetical protein